MSKSKRLIALSCLAVLCSYSSHAQTMCMGIEEMFNLADVQSESIRAYKTGKIAADEALKAAKARRLPDISVSVSASVLSWQKLTHL